MFQFGNLSASWAKTIWKAEWHFGKSREHLHAAAHEVFLKWQDPSCGRFGFICFSIFRRKHHHSEAWFQLWFPIYCWEPFLCFYLFCVRRKKKPQTTNISDCTGKRKKRKKKSALVHISFKSRKTQLQAYRFQVLNQSSSHRTVFTRLTFLSLSVLLTCRRINKKQEKTTSNHCSK